jgi:hypothetical protein
VLLVVTTLLAASVRSVARGTHRSGQGIALRTGPDGRIPGFGSPTPVQAPLKALREQ